VCSIVYLLCLIYYCFGIKVWDKEKIVIIPDHYIFTRDERANRNVDILRDFCMEQNIKYFYDIKDLSNFKV
jgi:3-isopropylmalate/(R)-2-methylmalate dehydratase large subunit